MMVITDFPFEGVQGNVPVVQHRNRKPDTFLQTDACSSPCRACESVPSLQTRFRHIDVRVNDDAHWPSPLPVSWLLAEKSAQRLQFVETQYDTQRTEESVRQIFPRLQQILATPMSLKSIFLALARTYRLSV